MKPTLASIILCIIFAIATQVISQESAPVLSISEALRSAQAVLDQEKLPKEYFIRSITLVESPRSASIPQYEARYEPPQTRRVKIGSDPEPIKYSVIVVTMDGKAKITEREFTTTRRVITDLKSTADATNK